MACDKSIELTESTRLPQSVNERIPSYIIDKADSFIISKTGPAFFYAYIKYDSSHTMYYPPDTFCIAHPSMCANFLRYGNYLIEYTFRIYEKPEIKGNIEFVMDSIGNIVLERSPYGIPECVSDSNNCLFKVDSSSAVAIARQMGLEEGIKPWRTQFSWSAITIKNYVWTVSNTLFDSASTMFGRNATIDANSGAFLGFLNWGAFRN